jgi:fermentation-respiration switch protein FrsA (DUF1100 family)
VGPKRRGVVELLAVAVLAAVFVVASPSSAGAAGACRAGEWADGCATVYDGQGLIVEDVTYPNGPTPSLSGRVCRPQVAGRHPVIVLDHAASLDGDLTYYEDGFCLRYAAYGYVVLMPRYRPNPLGPPNDSFCLAEVGDVVAMIDHARALPYVDGTDIVMRGISLGGCVTLRIHQQGLPGLRAAAVLSAPTDLARVYDSAADQFAAHLCLAFPAISHCREWRFFKDLIADSVGGPPGADTGSAYDARSPIRFAAQTAASAVPLLVVQGADDYGVPTRQTCAFAAAVDAAPGADLDPVHFGPPPDRAIDPTPPPGCEALGPWATTNPVVAGFPGDHYLFVVDGIEHMTPAQDFVGLVGMADSFLVLKSWAR